jgi:hypothetical protein
LFITYALESLFIAYALESLFITYALEILFITWTNNDLKNITHKTKDRATGTPLKTGDELWCSGRVAVPSFLLWAPVLLL